MFECVNFRFCEEDVMQSEQEGSASPLESLLVEDGEQAVETLLHETLKPFASFTRTGQMVMKPEFLKLPQNNRLLVCLLGRHAMMRLKLPSASLELRTEDLARECSVELKSCREHLSRCKARRLLDKNENGYFVPAWAIPNAAKIIRDGA